MLRTTLVLASSAACVTALAYGCARSTDGGTGGSGATTTTTTTSSTGGTGGSGALGGGGSGTGGSGALGGGGSGTGGSGGGCSGVADVTAVDYPVLAHGGALAVTGAGFTGTSLVTLGGVSVPFTVNNDGQLTLGPLPDGVPLGTQNLVVTSPCGASTPFALTVIHLVVNELDCNQPLTDAVELVELSAGVPNVSLAGYALVFYNGGGNVCYFARDLDATTDANGLLLTGNAGVVPAPAATCQWPSDTLQNGPDAVAVYQTAAAGFVTAGPNATPVTAAQLIDALVYETADADAGTLLDTLLGPAPYAGRVQVDEGPNSVGGLSETQSIQRCADGRRDGRRFAVGAPTPGAANGVTPCP
ncbi:MAG: hypothetical protein HY908_03420 [Myxococcales bacterium]|nr:hypothetical protein [Myxococcales bacterium]